MKIMVIGSSGMLGREMSKHFANEDIFKYDLPEFDMLNTDQLDQSISTFKPDFIVQTAAITNVDKCENDLKDAAFKVNIQGTANVASMCSKYNIPMIYISTDFVFNKNNQIKCLETDNTNPESIYGLTKFLGEQAVRYTPNIKATIIRTAWLYGNTGPSFVHTMIRLMKSKESLNVVGDQFGNPTSTIELCNIIECVIKNGFSNNINIVHGVTQGFTTWYGFACKIKELYEKYSNEKLNCVLNSIHASEYKRAAKTPMYSVLETSFLKDMNAKNLYKCVDWETALETYISENIDILKSI